MERAARITGFNPGQSPPPLQKPIVRMLLAMNRKAPEATQDFTPTIARASQGLRSKVSIEARASVIVRFCYNAWRFERDDRFCRQEDRECRVSKN
jgi:hypothetical protein